MSSHLSLLLLWTPLLLSIAFRYSVHCTVIHSTDSAVIVTFSGGGDHISDDLENKTDLVHEEDGEDEEDLLIRDVIIDDSIRVQAVIKPGETEATTKKAPKKKGDKKKKNGQKKKKNPCLTTHVNFCVHGECKYLTRLQEISCRCHPNYFGERCIERSMKTGSGEQNNDMTTTTVLAVVAVLLSLISIVAIIIIFVVHTRRKNPFYKCEAEEKKKLGQENGSEEVDV